MPFLIGKEHNVLRGNLKSNPVSGFSFRSVTLVGFPDESLCSASSFEVIIIFKGLLFQLNNLCLKLIDSIRSGLSERMF